MGTATAISVTEGRKQFQGLFSEIYRLEFTIDPASMGSNAVDATAVACSGMDPQTDVVIGWTHYHAGVHGHEVVETFHTWTDELHVVLHNVSGGTVDLPSTVYTVLVGRLV